MHATIVRMKQINVFVWNMPFGGTNTALTVRNWIFLCFWDLGLLALLLLRGNPGDEDTVMGEACPIVDPPYKPNYVAGQPACEEQPETDRAWPTYTMAELVAVGQSLISEMAIAGSSDDVDDLGMELRTCRRIQHF